MADSSQGLQFGNKRKKTKPRERPVDFARESFPTSSESSRNPRSMSESTATTPSTKTPIILAKPDSNDMPKVSSPSSESIKLRQVFDNNSSSPTSPLPGSNVLASQEQRKSTNRVTAEPYRLHSGQMQQSKPAFSGQTKSPQAGDALSNLKEKINNMRKPVKMLDASLHWSDVGIEQLRDQTDFMVVGVIGMQGVGKSTILSFLAGNNTFDPTKKFTFPVQTQDIKERAGHMTSGVDMFVTPERMILLDAQPILSASVLEQCIFNERKMSADYNSSYNGVEMQSLQIATFFFIVCHVILVVQDWFTDPNIYKFLQSAEMLRPNQDNSGTDNEYSEFHPHIIFIQNKADTSLFEPSNIVAMNSTISSIMKHSKLIHKGSFSLPKSQLFPAVSYCISMNNEVNMFLFPEFDEDEKDSDVTNTFNTDEHFSKLPKYKGHPSTELMVETFKNMVLSMPRIPLTRHVLNEKNWFYYASKTWETLKKSPLMSEYNRLLS